MVALGLPNDRSRGAEFNSHPLLSIISLVSLLLQVLGFLRQFFVSRNFFGIYCCGSNVLFVTKSK